MSAEGDRWVRMFFQHRIWSFIVRNKRHFSFLKVFQGLLGWLGFVEAIGKLEKRKIFTKNNICRFIPLHL